jgi:hypothetical protein
MTCGSVEFCCDTKYIGATGMKCTGGAETDGKIGSRHHRYRLPSPRIDTMEFSIHGIFRFDDISLRNHFQT